MPPIGNSLNLESPHSLCPAPGPDVIFVKMFTLADFGPIIFYPKRVATFYILGQNRVKSVSDKFTSIKEVKM